MAKQKRTTNTESAKASGSLAIDLGLTGLVDPELLGYMPSRPELVLTPKATQAVKRLSLTLEREEATLSNGAQVRNSVSKSIVWLCERLADTVG